MKRDALKNSLHTSSLYLLKTLHFLSHPMFQDTPATLSDLQKMFEEDPTTQVTLSLDTLRLYIIALEDSGCVIERGTAPHARGIRLHGHPFAMQFCGQEWVDILNALGHQLSTTNTAAFMNAYDFIEHLISLQVLHTSQKLSLRDLLDQYFPEGLSPTVRTLSQQEPLEHVYFTHYQSKQFQHEWTLLHDAVVLVGGRMYWLCYRLEEENRFVPMMLRLNRCRSIHALDEALSVSDLDTVRTAIHRHLQQEDPYTLWMAIPKGMNLTLPGLKQERARVVDPIQSLNFPHIQDVETFYQRPCYVMAYTVQTLHAFYLRMCLHESGAFLFPQNDHTRTLLDPLTGGAPDDHY